jgi:hypothetical protein
MVQMTVDEAATEALEADNLALQTMSGGKYVQARPAQGPASRGPARHAQAGGAGSRLALPYPALLRRATRCSWRR